ncbi:MAG: NAD(P)/FAD-dependent oxidoreductase [Chloroflexota bacterium]
MSQYDVIIIGGGVSGVYSAWRLLSEKKAKKVAIFEADNHIGGRLLSVTPPNIPFMTAELGGMRILPAVQPRIQKLIDALNKDTTHPDDYIETFPFPVDQPNNISYLRGTYLRLSDFQSDPDKVPYRLTFQEFGKTAGQLVINAIEQVIPGITNKNRTEQERREMAHQAKFDGLPLYRQGFWQVLMRVMSGEAYQLAKAAGGYQTTINNWNAADAIPWFLSDFGVAPEYHGFKEGFQQIPLTLAERVKELGGEIFLNSRVIGFDQKERQIEINLHDGTVHRAGALILAMPRRSLDLLSPGSPLLCQPHVKRLISSVTPRPLFKLFTTYMEPWWIPAGVTEGRSTTDLPIRQTYYWPKVDGEAPTSGRAMLMASYDDGLNVGFWDGFRLKHGIFWEDEVQAIVDKPDDTFWFEGTVAETGDSYPKWHQYRAPEEMVEEIQRQLADVHGLKHVPSVIDASYKDWGDDPFGGGWNAWNIGVKSWEVKREIINPDPDAPVYICGEAYSDAQGWVEGALQTADMMLEQYFDVTNL